VACGREATYTETDRVRRTAVGRLRGKIVRATNLVPPGGIHDDDCDPYCKLVLESHYPQPKGKEDKVKDLSSTNTWHIEGTKIRTQPGTKNKTEPVLNPV
jgi:hypothetical protein